MSFKIVPAIFSCIFNTSRFILSYVRKNIFQLVPNERFLNLHKWNNDKSKIWNCSCHKSTFRLCRFRSFKIGPAIFSLICNTSRFIEPFKISSPIFTISHKEALAVVSYFRMSDRTSSNSFPMSGFFTFTNGTMTSDKSKIWYCSCHHSILRLCRFRSFKIGPAIFSRIFNTSRFIEPFKISSPILHKEALAVVSYFVCPKEHLPTRSQREVSLPSQMEQ
jgi:hypothetical protein